MSAIFRLAHGSPITTAGLLAPGAKVYVYLTGTTTLASVWTDQGLSVAGANPIVADAAGVLPVRWLDNSLVYRIDVKTSADALITSDDPGTDPLPTAATLGSILYPRTAAEIAAGVTPTNYQYPVCNLLRYGTNTSPGVTDMSTAWASAIAVANQLNFSGVYAFGSARVYVPPGDYLINTGTSVVNLNCEIVGDGREITRITVATGQTLLTASGTIAHFRYEGISFSGGFGYLWHTSTGVNVQDQFDIVRCSFYLYTACAIGSTASDFPYWKIKGCLFYGAAALTSKGIVHSGNPDNVTIEDCSFLRNRYHVQLERGNNAKFVNCDFLRFTAGGGSPVLVDVWLVPYSSAVNAGSGLEFQGCKFGNETLGTTDIRILVADIDTSNGVNAIDRYHSTSVSSGYLDGLTIDGGAIFAASNMARGFVFSYTPNIRDVKINSFWDGRYPYAIEFHSSVTVPNDRTVDSWSIPISTLQLPSESVFGAVSNIKTVNHGADPLYQFYGASDFKAFYSTGYDPGFSSLWSQASAGATAFTASSATKSNITDSVGDADAAEWTFSASNGSVLADLDTPTANRLAWAEIEVMTGASLPLTQLDIRIDNSGGDIIARRLVTIPSTWQRIRIPFVVRDTATGCHLKILPGDYSAGVKTKVKLGRPIVYHATDQTDSGQRYFTAQKTFDWPNILAAGTSTTTVTCTGAALGDFAFASMDLDLTGLVLTAYVSSANTITVVAFNPTAGAINLASGTLRVRAQKAVVYH